MNSSAIIVLLIFSVLIKLDAAPNKETYHCTDLGNETQKCEDSKRIKRHSVEPYKRDDNVPFLIVAEDEDNNDLENAESSHGGYNTNDSRYYWKNDKQHMPLDDDIDVNNGMTEDHAKQPFIIRVPDLDLEPTKPTPVEIENDLDEEQTRYVANGPFLIQVEDTINADLVQPDFDPNLQRGIRNTKQIRDQATRDVSELNTDLARQRDALRRQEAADRQREKEALRRQEIEIRLQLEQQRRLDELQLQKDLRESSDYGSSRSKRRRRPGSSRRRRPGSGSGSRQRGSGHRRSGQRGSGSGQRGGGSSRRPGRRGQQSAYEEYDDSYDEDISYNDDEDYYNN